MYIPKLYVVTSQIHVAKEFLKALRYKAFIYKSIFTLIFQNAVFAFVFNEYGSV